MRQGTGAQNKIAEVYPEVSGSSLKKNNALDFDDLIFKTVELFRTNADVLEYYQERFRYIMVDEYQDTNTAQFRLIELSSRQNIRISAWWAMMISPSTSSGVPISSNILDFESAFPGAKVIKPGAELPLHQSHSGCGQRGDPQ